MCTGSQPPPPYYVPVPAPQQGATSQAPVGVFDQGARFNSTTKPNIPVSVALVAGSFHIEGDGFIACGV